MYNSSELKHKGALAGPFRNSKTDIVMPPSDILHRPKPVTKPTQQFPIDDSQLSFFYNQLNQLFPSPLEPLQSECNTSATTVKAHPSPRIQAPAEIMVSNSPQIGLSEASHRSNNLTPEKFVSLYL